MRLLILLIAVAIVGVLAARQFAGPPDRAASGESGTAAPEAPTRPQDLEGFERDMDRFVEESDAARREAIEEQAR